jgi:hypothetical protein
VGQILQRAAKWTLYCAAAFSRPSRRSLVLTQSRRPPATGTGANGRPILRTGEHWPDILAKDGGSQSP